MARKWLAVFLVFPCAALFWQSMNIRKLRAEGERVRAQLAQAEALRSRQEEMLVSSAQPDEQRLHADQAELNRLRGEVSQLRKDLKAGQLAGAKRSHEAAATNSPAEPASPVQSYSASVRANVPFAQTLVTGGWKLPSGKHALFFIAPQLIDRLGNVAQPGSGADQISLQTHIVELSDQALARLGLDSLKSDSIETGAQLTLNETQARAILDNLRQTEGVDVLGAPRVLTLSGHQTQVKIANTFIGPTGEPFETGPMVDVVPTVGPDGQSADLQLKAQVRLRR